MSYKPLDGKGYGSIPHLPGSRTGIGDHHCDEGQRSICCDRARRGDRVIVTEKLDGSNVCVANVDGEILAINRAGHLCQTSPYEQHRMFAEWIKNNENRFRAAMPSGHRIVGEWLAQAHGTRYRLTHEPFVAFDFFWQKRRDPYDALLEVCRLADLPSAAVLHDGGAISIDDVLPLLAVSKHGAIDPVEGAVWRVETDGIFNFMAKWVRPDKIDGSLLPDVNGSGVSIWNWRPS